MSRERIYGFEQNLRSAPTHRDRMQLLRTEYRDILADINPAHFDTARQWKDIKESGLYDLLMTWISTVPDDEDLVRHDGNLK